LAPQKRRALDALPSCEKTAATVSTSPFRSGRIVTPRM
jgi:hypothetical protein